MTNPGPIKRSQALIEFSKDHHFALLLIWKIRQGLHFGVETKRINNYISFFFQNYLEEHFKDEEKLLFIHLGENNRLRKLAEQDHNAIRELASKIKFNPADHSIPTAFANRLEKHIRLEERELFNELQNILSESDLNTISKIEALHPRQKEDDWKDSFWIKK